MSSECIYETSFGPIGKTCKDCIFFRGIKYLDYDIGWCDLMQMSVESKQRVCALFEERITDERSQD